MLLISARIPLKMIQGTPLPPERAERSCRRGAQTTRRSSPGGQAVRGVDELERLRGRRRGQALLVLHADDPDAHARPSVAGPDPPAPPRPPGWAGSISRALPATAASATFARTPPPASLHLIAAVGVDLARTEALGTRPGHLRDGRSARQARLDYTPTSRAPGSMRIRIACTSPTGSPSSGPVVVFAR